MAINSKLVVVAQLVDTVEPCTIYYLPSGFPGMCIEVRECPYFGASCLLKPISEIPVMGEPVKKVIYHND